MLGFGQVIPWLPKPEWLKAQTVLCTACLCLQKGQVGRSHSSLGNLLTSRTWLKLPGVKLYINQTILSMCNIPAVKRHANIAQVLLQCKPELCVIFSAVSWNQTRFTGWMLWYSVFIVQDECKSCLGKKSCVSNLVHGWSSALQPGKKNSPQCPEFWETSFSTAGGLHESLDFRQSQTVTLGFFLKFVSLPRPYIKLKSCRVQLHNHLYKLQSKGNRYNLTKPVNFKARWDLCKGRC